MYIGKYKKTRKCFVVLFIMCNFVAQTTNQEIT